MKVLFLDIDGVCNCRATEARFGGFIGIDKHMARRVRQIVQDTGCSVVLSSTWRLDAKSREHVREMVTEFIDVTKSLGRGFRGDEVQEWLDRHPDVTRYAILDDDGDFHDGQPLFQTSFMGDGLTPEIEKQVTQYLKGEIEYENRFRLLASPEPLPEGV